MNAKRKFGLEKVSVVLLVVLLVFTRDGQCQDVGSFLAGLLGAAEPPKNESIVEHDQVPCPGECVHAFTSILCSKVIEQFNCGAGYLRCCVSSDFTFGTVVETSAPLPEEVSTESVSDYDVYLLTTVPNRASTVKQQTENSTSIKYQLHPAPQPGTNLNVVSNVIKKLKPCPGICVENRFVPYCTSTDPDGFCEEGSTCCVGNREDANVPPPILPTTTTTTISPTTERITTTTERAYGIKPQSNQFSDSSQTSSLPGLPCPGSCVAPLFSLLCDAVDDNFYCTNDGRCCVNNEDLYTEPPTTTALPQPSLPCPGACIPMFLRGMCNRPSEIISVTECDENFVCCYQPDLKDHLHVEAPQIPLLRPIAPQTGYPSLPIPQNNGPAAHQPTLSHPYAQRPHVPMAPNPVQPIIVPHIHNQGNGGQVYSGSNRPGYPAVPQSHPSYKPPRVNPSVVNIAFQPNGNYDGSSYQPQNFIPVAQKQNTSQEVQPIRLTVLAPVSQPGSIHSDDYFHHRKPNVSQILPQHSKPGPSPLFSPNDNVALGLIPPSSSTGEVSAVMVDDIEKQQSAPDRFVETAIAFAPDALRPVKINVPKNPSPQDKLHQNSPRPSFKPQLKNTSKILLIHVKEPQGHRDVIHDSEYKPDISSTPLEPAHDSFKPLISQTPFKPTPNPIRVSQNPATIVVNPKPILATEKPKPVEPVEDTEGKPSNSDLYFLSSEQAKKIRPACPGSCIASFLRFTCFGNNAIYDGFACEGTGIMCCTSVDYIEKYEEHLQSGTPLIFIKPDLESKGIQAPSESARRPGMYVCGIKGNQRRKSARVMGGKTSSPGEWCWQVALINAKNQYLCGGALIGSRWVLTAAHCITALVRNGDAIYVRVGDFDLASQVGSPGAQTQKVSTSYIHHNHNGQTLDNDIALLRLENPVQLQESVCLVCLPARGAESTPGKKCTVTGYGYVSEAGPIALKIREAELPIVEEKLCTEQINKVTEKRFILPAGSFCAGGEPENDACQGDGGGPLTCLNEGYYELTGLVSWGFGCGKKDVPGVYVKVSSYIGWINQIISVNN